MSFMRQIWLLLLATLALAFVGAVGISLFSERHHVEAELSRKNQDTARIFALLLSGQTGSLADSAKTLVPQFDLGFVQQVRLLDPQGRLLAELNVPDLDNQVPQWVSQSFPVHSTVGVARIERNQALLGSVEVLCQSRTAMQRVWRSFLHMLWGMLGLVGVIALAGDAVLLRIRQPLMATMRQAQALTERRFVTVPEPEVPELRNVTRAMNGMVERLRAMFEEQAGQVELLRRQAHCDELTWVFNRVHFLGRLKSLLSDEDGSSGGALVLVRICDLQGVNRRLGRVQTDKLLREVGAALLATGRQLGMRFEAGRLSGSDFAVMLLESSSLREPAMEVTSVLRDLLRRHSDDATAVVGAVRWWHGAPVSSLLAAGDHALARAEARGPFAVELYDSGEVVMSGEDTWHAQLSAALEFGHAQLVEWPVLDVNRAVLHLECPLRLRLDGSEPLPAAQWLPMAGRTGMTALIDLRAVELALQAIAVDGMARAVNISPSSLRDTSLLPQLRALLSTHASEVPGLWLEVSESGAMRDLRLLRELVLLAHVRGAKVGFEHAGEHLADGDVLLEAGLDFVKLESSFTEGLATDPARAYHVASTVRMLHGLGIKTFAEGVSSSDDARLLWQIGVEGVSGLATEALAAT